MNFLDRIFEKRLTPVIEEKVSKNIEQQIKQEIDDTLDPIIMDMLVGFIGKGTTISWNNNFQKFIENAYRINADVYAVSSLVANGAAQILKDVKLMETDREGNKEELTDHAILEVLRRPNPNQSWKELTTGWMNWYTVTGNGILNGVRLEMAGPNQGEIRSLYEVPTDMVSIIASGDFRQPIQGYSVQFGHQFEKRILDVKDISHLKTWNPNFRHGAQFMGMSPFEAAGLAIAAVNEGHQAKVRKYHSGGIEGFISKGSGADSVFTPDQSEKLTNYLQTKYAGYKRSLYATGANAKWNSIGMSVVDLAILDALNADKRTICSMLNVDSKLLNDPGASTYNNMTEAEKSTYQKAIIPRVEDGLDELNLWLTPAYEKNGRFHGTKGKLSLEADYSKIECLQEDKSDLIDRFNKLIAVRPKDQLEAMGLDVPEDPLLQEYWITVPGGRIPLSDYQNRNLDTNLEEEAEKVIKRLVQENHYLLNGTSD